MYNIYKIRKLEENRMRILILIDTLVEDYYSQEDYNYILEHIDSIIFKINEEIAREKINGKNSK